MATDISIYEPIGRSIGDVLVQGTPTGATATTMDSNVLIFPDAQKLKGKELFLFEGQGAGQARTITLFDPSTNRVTIEPQFSIVPTADTKFLIFEHYQVQDYENAMNRSMGKVKLRHLVDMVATASFVATQYEYAVPSGMEWISTLRLIPSGNSAYRDHIDIRNIFEIPPRFWRIEANQGGSYIIAIDPRQINLNDFNGQIFDIKGQSKPDFGGTLIEEDLQEYIIMNSSMLLTSQRVMEDQEWRNKFIMFRDEVRTLEDYIVRNGRGKHVGS